MKDINAIDLVGFIEHPFPLTYSLKPRASQWYRNKRGQNVRFDIPNLLECLEKQGDSAEASKHQECFGYNWYAHLGFFRKQRLTLLFFRRYFRVLFDKQNKDNAKFQLYCKYSATKQIAVRFGIANLKWSWYTSAPVVEGCRKSLFMQEGHTFRTMASFPFVSQLKMQMSDVAEEHHKDIVFSVGFTMIMDLLSDKYALNEHGLVE